MKLPPTKAKAAKHPCLAAPTRHQPKTTGFADFRSSARYVKLRAGLAMVHTMVCWGLHAVAGLLFVLAGAFKLIGGGHA